MTEVDQHLELGSGGDPRPQHGESDFADGFLAFLAVMVCAVAVFDFLISREGKQRIRTKLEDWWLYLQYTRFDKIGLAEATFFYSLSTKVLGVRFFSIKRIIGSLWVYIALICTFYIMIECHRLWVLPIRLTQTPTRASGCLWKIRGT